MRRVLVGVCLGLLALSPGCNTFNPNKGGGGGTADVTPRWTGTPKPEQLVAVLNQNAQVITSFEAKDAFIKAKQDRDEFGLATYLACQKSAKPGTPPNFRLQGQVLGNDEVDIGANSEEFWFWIKRGGPYVYHCSHADYKAIAARGTMPFPVQPEWVAEALGMMEYDPKTKWEVDDRSSKTYNLIDRTSSPNGDVAKVIAFHKSPRPGTFPVAMYVLNQYDPAKKQWQTLCSAVVTDSQVVQVGGGRTAVLPREVRLTCPREKMEMTIDLGKLAMNVPFDQDRSRALFTRQSLRNIKSYDLARSRPDEPAGDVRPAGGIQR
jgi:hypothetical protein